MEVILGKIIDFIGDISTYAYSDIHIKENENIALRILGDIYFSNCFVELKDIEEFFKEINLDSVDYLKKVSEVDFSFYSSQFRFRGNIFFSMGRLSISLRRIDNTIKSFRELLIPIAVESLCNFSSGLVFITGPTGSGKTTSLAAIIDYINENSKRHIITIEDPIEFVFKNKNSIITQREVGKDTASFSDAIKSALRQDPDVIVIGEIRDKDTMINAISAAQTGHLCFCTLHTIGAVDTIERIMGFFSGDEKEKIRFELSIVLKAILSQQLIKLEDSRLPIVEFIKIEKSISNIIKEGKINQIQNYIQINSSKGLVSMDSELLKMYYKGFINREDILRKCLDKEYVLKNIDKGIFKT